MIIFLILSRGGSYGVDIYDTCQFLLKEGSLGATTLNISCRHHRHRLCHTVIIKYSKAKFIIIIITLFSFQYFKAER